MVDELAALVEELSTELDDFSVAADFSDELEDAVAAAVLPFVLLSVA